MSLLTLQNSYQYSLFPWEFDSSHATGRDLKFTTLTLGNEGQSGRRADLSAKVT